MKTLKRIFFDESGSPALEYALILGLVGLAIVTSMSTLSSSLGKMMQDAALKVEDITQKFGNSGGD